MVDHSVEVRVELGPVGALGDPEAFLDGRYARMRPRTVGVRADYRF